MGKLYVVATPIGNLDDISSRALDILKMSDLILAEDPSVTQKLLNHFNISIQVKRYDEHNADKIFDLVSNVLLGGDICLVSDSGTPGISDPGGKLVKFVRENVDGAEVQAVPGPSAVIAALSVSGMPTNEFTFLGFPPAKNKRKKFFKKIVGIEIRPVVLYEAPHRMLKTLKDLGNFLGEDSEVFIAREITKIYEDYFCGTIDEAVNHFEGVGVKGEFVILIR